MFPDRTQAIIVHRDSARRMAAAGQYREAPPSFMKCVESAKQQNGARLLYPDFLVQPLSNVRRLSNARRTGIDR